MIGQILGNRYEILDKIGNGGMAYVYKAKCRLLNRFVAVKVLRHEFIEDQEFINRFNIESQAAASLSHPNVVSIYDVGQQENIHYIVMEYVEGITLKEYILKNAPLAWKEALNFATQIGSALEHAHKKHIVHRDIKPHNIIVAKDGVLKVTDFGIARAATSSTVTLGGSTIGSVHYFSPEQARGGYTDEKSDIYSLGIVMYEMLTGRIPFDGESPVAIAMKHIHDEPPAPRSINPNIPVALESIILKAISKEQRVRYESAGAMLKDLYAAYDHPDTNFNNLTEQEALDSYPTQKIPIIKGKELTADKSEDAGQTKKKTSKEDKVAIVSAVATSLVIIGIISFVIIKIFFPSAVGGTKGEVQVPKLIGQTVESAKNLYSDQNLKIVEDQQVFSDEFEKGRIVSQEPAADTLVKAPSDIHVVVSKGVETIKLPKLTNVEYRQAEIELERLKLNYKMIEEYSDTVVQGYVTRQIPEAQQEIKATQVVQLFVSKGAEVKPVKVPDLVGKSEDEAKRTIELNGLKVGNITYEEDDVPKGTVIKQELEADSEVQKNSLVNFVVSSGKTTPLKEQTLTINLPQDKETVRVKVVANYGAVSKTVYDKLLSKNNSPVDVKITGTGKVQVQVYFDNELKHTEVLDFGGDSQ